MRHLQLDPLILCRHPVLAGLHSPSSVLASFGSLLISPVDSSFSGTSLSEVQDLTLISKMKPSVS